MFPNTTIWLPFKTTDPTPAPDPTKTPPPKHARFPATTTSVNVIDALAPSGAATPPPRSATLSRATSPVNDTVPFPLRPPPYPPARLSTALTLFPLTDPAGATNKPPPSLPASLVRKSTNANTTELPSSTAKHPPGPSAVFIWHTTLDRNAEPEPDTATAPPRAARDPDNLTPDNVSVPLVTDSISPPASPLGATPPTSTPFLTVTDAVLPDGSVSTRPPDPVASSVAPFKSSTKSLLVSPGTIPCPLPPKSVNPVYVAPASSVTVPPGATASISPFTMGATLRGRGL